MATNLLAQLSKEFVSGGSDTADIITFVESPWGLSVNLTPVQRFTLKCTYGMPLDDETKSIEIPDVINEHILYRFTEKEFQRWLYAEKRCNVEETEGHIWQNLILAWGRRSGKSLLAACISNYETYRLVRQPDPAKYYNQSPGTTISILNVAPSDDQASELFDTAQMLAMKCPYIKDRVLRSTMTYFDVQTDADIQLGGKKRASIVSLSGGCSSNSLRGKNAIIIIMDEMAFFIDNNGRFSGSEVYNALEPSRLTFRRDGKVVCISSPYAKFGKFYELWQESFQNTELTLAFKMYSSMVNPPRCETAILKAARKANRTKFMGEYGAEFSDTVTAWVEDEAEIKQCVTNTTPSNRGVHDVAYYYGIDLGFKNDGTAVAIVHKDQAANRIVLDYANVWYSGSSDVWEVEDSIYKHCNKFASLDLLRMSDVVNEIKELTKWFPAKNGIFDQHNGYALAELFQSEHLPQFEMENFSESLNSEVYQLVKRMYSEQLLVLFDHPILMKEILTLEAEKRSRDKVIVRAPLRKAAHDDISDAFCRAVWKCYNSVKDRPANISTGSGGRLLPLQGGGRVDTQASFIVNRLKQHGEHPRGLYGAGGRRRLMMSR